MTDYSSSVQISPQPLAPDRIRDLEAENRALRAKVWHLQFMSTLTAGIGLIIAGAATLVISYFASSAVMTLGGLGLVFWGAVLLYISPSKYVPEKILSSLSLSTVKSIDKLLVSMNFKGRTIFLHPRHLAGLAQGYVFIPHETSDQASLPSDEQLAEEKTMYEVPKGIFMVAPSQGLVGVIERELDINLATVDFEYLKENLPKILVNNLRLIDSVVMAEHGDLIRINITGESAAAVCNSVNTETSIGDHFGCPLCSALALVISKISGKPVSIQETKADVINGTITSAYRRLEPAK